MSYVKAEDVLPKHLVEEIQQYSGSAGAAHGPTYHIADFDSACMDSAKAQVMTIRRLLEHDAEKARLIIQNATPQFASKEEFLAYLDSQFSDKEAVIYEENGKITLDI